MTRFSRGDSAEIWEASTGFRSPFREIRHFEIVHHVRACDCRLRFVSERGFVQRRGRFSSALIRTERATCNVRLQPRLE